MPNAFPVATRDSLKSSALERMTQAEKQNRSDVPMRLLTLGRRPRSSAGPCSSHSSQGRQLARLM